MREILFRGKRKDCNAWEFGNFSSYSRYDSTYHYYINGFEYEVYPETVGQYTGLTDKNDKKIFEGDIVSITALGNDHFQKGARTIACIENHMGNSCICVYGGSLGITLYSILIDHTVEVIGNIHDNPELLKGGEG